MEQGGIGWKIAKQLISVPLRLLSRQEYKSRFQWTRFLHQIQAEKSNLCKNLDLLFQDMVTVNSTTRLTLMCSTCLLL